MRRAAVVLLACLAGCGDGDKARPALRFAGVPAGAAELALIVVDPDAGGFVHWTAYALPPTTRALGATGLPAGAREDENSTGARGWTPPCAPARAPAACSSGATRAAEARVRNRAGAGPRRR